LLGGLLSFVEILLTMNTCPTIEAIKNPYTYTEFKNLVTELAEKESSTGEISEEKIAATKINAQRIKRIDKQYVVSEEVNSFLKLHKREWLWLVLIESWCGDAAQNIPVIAKIAEQSPNIELKLILRDENLPIMDAYLTNNSRSIPKLICIDKESGEEIGTWGSRPMVIQEAAMQFKALNPDVSHTDFVTHIHSLYAKDKGNALQQEFIDLLKIWIKRA